MMFRMV